MKYTKIPSTTFQQLTLNAGIVCSAFTLGTAPSDADIIGATSGGVTFTAIPSFVDFGEDIDNCPKNAKELKQLDSWEIKISGTFVTITPTVAKKLLAAADVATNKVTPRRDLLTADFADLWWVGDYSDKNGATNGGYMAIKLINALSTGGLSLTVTDRAKGQFAFEFTAHSSLTAADTVPVEVYVVAGTAEPAATNNETESP